MTIAHGPSPAPDEHVLRHRRAVDEVPLLRGAAPRPRSRARTRRRRRGSPPAPARRGTCRPARPGRARRAGSRAPRTRRHLRGSPTRPRPTRPLHITSRALTTKACVVAHGSHPSSYEAHSGSSEPRVRLVGLPRLLRNARVVLRGDLVDGVENLLALPAPTGHDDHARPVPRADEDVLRHRRAVHEVPRLQPALLAVEDEDALPGDDEEVLLIRLAVVHAVRLAGLEHGDAEADLGELRLPFEHGGLAESRRFATRGRRAR